MRICQKQIYLAVSLMFALATGVAAGQSWQAELLHSSETTSLLPPETRQSAKDGLPDGLIEEEGGAGDITAAWYSAPTTRYGHGILGDAVEAGELKVRDAAGKVFSLMLPETEVFEDRYPRLADLDGDGATEIVTIRSSLTFGAAVTVYNLKDDVLLERASTPFIGRAHRWLNIAGIDHFKGGEPKQIAFVQTPHIGGTLYFYELQGDRLIEAASLYGFSNHAIGSREMRLSATSDVNGDGTIDLALPSDNRNALRIMGFINGKLTELGNVALPSKIDKAIAVDQIVGKLRFIVGLSNGQNCSVTRSD